ncbi:MAG: hypothetical protein NTU60_02820 [Candidatus Aminicenantes bacterium]|nr:hypothetical protein [Candidatus Aminicenantes bacterium]
MTTKAKILALTILLAPAGIAFGETASIQVRASYFHPSDGVFKEVYGGGTSYGAVLTVRLWKGFSLWAEGDFFQKKGRTTFTREQTEFRLIPLAGGLRYDFFPSRTSPYLAAGVGYFLSHEKNDMGSVDRKDIGYVVQAGLRLYAGKTVIFDVQGSYSTCKVSSSGVSADLGGIRGGLSLGFAF